MYDIGDFVFLDYLFVGGLVANVQLFELTREVNFSITDIASYDLVSAQLLA